MRWMRVEMYKNETWPIPGESFARASAVFTQSNPGQNDRYASIFVSSYGRKTSGKNDLTNEMLE